VEQEGAGDGAVQCGPTSACAWWSALTAAPAPQGGVKAATAWWSGLAAEPAPQGGRAAFAGRELACGGLFGGSNRGGYRARQ